MDIFEELTVYLYNRYFFSTIEEHSEAKTYRYSSGSFSFTNFNTNNSV